MKADGGLPGLERNAVIAASAGTGKTELITSIYIAHVLGLVPGGPVPPERIAATTFSRLAAQEIRERLERRLGKLASTPSDEELRAFDPALALRAREMQLRPRELAERAARALTDLSRTLIDTLHGLSARVIRSQGRELGTGSGFVILDEQLAFEDAENVIEDVLSRTLVEGGAAGQAAVRLIDLAGGLDATRGALIGLLALLDEEGLDADQLLPEDPIADSETLLSAFSSGASALLGGEVDPSLRGPARRVVAALGQLPPDLNGLELAFDELLEQKAQNKIARLTEGKTFAQALERLLRGKSKRDRLRASVTFLKRAPELAEQSRAIAALIGSIQRTLRFRRIHQGTLGFGDLLRLARDALRDRPELAAQAAAELDLLLVDEFQDTSRVQRDLLLLLRERPEARALRQPGEMPTAKALAPRGLVVVGDRKQSIYAFRGADVSVFTEFLAELSGQPAATALDLRGVEPNPTPVADFVSLTTNYRSGAKILRFVNAVSDLDFAHNPTHSFEIRYSSAEALVPPRSGARGEGRVVLLEDDGSTPADAEASIANAEGPMRTAFVVAGFCARAWQAGTPLSGIAVLARRRSSLPLVELALDRLLVPFVVSGRALYRTPEVRDLAALLRVSLDPYNRHALATVARSPLGGLSDCTLAELARPGRGLLTAKAWQFEPISDTAERLRARELSGRLVELELTLPLLSPRDALAYTVERFELETVLGGLPRGAVRFGNVGRLLEIASTHGGSLPIFLRWLDRQIALDTDESEAAVFSEADEAVRLLTIHASKGLSFPITVLVDLDAIEQVRSPPLGLLRGAGAPELVIRHRGPEGAVTTPLLSRALHDGQARARAERQRLSYVALTRAERELVLALPRASRPGSLAASISELLESDLVGALEIERLAASQLLATSAIVPDAPALPSPPPPRPARGRVDSVAVGVTALADFVLCPRRFSLIHVFGIEEPEQLTGRGPQAGQDPRQLGSAAHRVLERFPLERWGEPIPLDGIIQQLVGEGLDRHAEETERTADGIRRFLEGDYARSLRSSGARVERELELALVLTLTDQAAEGLQLQLFTARERPAQAIVKAMLDLVVHHSDGSVDVIDYKRSRGGDSERYLMQLSTYGQAVRQVLAARSVRTGLVHLLAESAEPEWITPPPVDLPANLTELVGRRYSGDYPPIPPAQCRRVHCGFLASCHPGRRTDLPRPSSDPAVR